MTTWITDDNGNRASVEYWGSEETARAMLNTLKNCTGCIDCSNCNHCIDCTNCTGCTGCNYCNQCNYCIYCNHCNNCKIKGPTRSDGYTFYFNHENVLCAGCRKFNTINEAIAHWSTRHPGTNLALETKAILSYMEKIWPKPVA